jgi:replicative DNA helicase
LCQVNRECDKQDRPPRLSDLRDSGSIEQDADLVAFLHPLAAENEYELLIAKHRTGPVCKLELIFRNDLTRFETLTRVPAPDEARA